MVLPDPSLIVTVPVMGSSFALLLIISVIGLPLGLFVLFGYLFSIFFALSLTAIVLARWLERRRLSEWGQTAVFFASLGLFVALEVLAMVPLLGWLIVAVLACGAFGALVVTEWQVYRQVA